MWCVTADNVPVQAYQWFNWRQNAAQDLVLFAALNLSLLLAGSAIKVLLHGCEQLWKLLCPSSTPVHALHQGQANCLACTFLCVAQMLS